MSEVIDISALVSHLTTQYEEVVESAIDVLLEAGLARINQLVGDKLSIEQQNTYLAAMKGATTRSKFSASITLQDPEAVRIEDGIPSWSIKDKMLASSSAKTSASGTKYVDVPLPHRVTKRKAGVTRGTYIEPRSMREAVQKAMQKVAQAKPGTKGARLRIPGARGDITAGMIVRHKKLGKQTTLESNTIRRISEDSTGWEYPAKPGLKAFELAAKELNDIKEQVVTDIMKRMGV